MTTPPKRKGRSMAPQGRHDVVLTPSALALSIITHFRPHGRIVDPCAGQGAFSGYLPACDWFEITDGKDFLTAQGPWDWAITNPPWGPRFLPILIKAMETCDNIVFLTHLNVWYSKCRLRTLREHGFGIVEMLELPTPPKPWPQAGLQLGATWLRKGWTGSHHHSHLPANL